jgi:hypothetical protein
MLCTEDDWVRELNDRAADPEHSISRTGNFTILLHTTQRDTNRYRKCTSPTMHESESTANLSEQHDKQKKQSCNHPVVAYAKQTTQHQNQQTNLQNTLLPQNFLKNKSLLILERKCTNWDQNMKHTMKGTPRRRQWAIA